MTTTDQNAAGTERGIAMNAMAEAWEKMRDNDVPTEVAASVALTLVFSELVGAYGEEAAARMAGRFAERIKQGSFSHKGAATGE